MDDLSEMTREQLLGHIMYLRSKEKNTKVYALIEWTFNEPSYQYVTFDLEVAKAWAEQEHTYGYYDYEEKDIYG